MVASRMTRTTFTAALGLATALAACASTSRRGPDGECKESIVTACQIGMRVECDVDEDGCEACTCVPIGGDDHGPLSPEERR